MKNKLLFIALSFILTGALFSQPTEEWERTYTSENLNDAGKKVAIDGLGNMFTASTIYFSGEFSKTKCVITKLSNNGITFDEKYLYFDSVYNDYLSDMAVDQGNCYVTGYTTVPGGYSDYFTYKLNPDLSVAWRSVYAGPYGASDIARSIAVDANGNVYVTGSGYNSSPYSDFTTVKYNSSGIQQWAVSYDGPANSYDDAMSIVVDPQGNVIVTGTSYGGAATEYDIATVKYGPSGNQLWVRRYNGPAYSDFAKAVTVDASSNIYVIGYSSGVGTGFDYVTLKYDPTGKQSWIQRYNGPANGHDYPYDIKIGISGDVYVTGSSAGINNENDFATVKYNSSGVLQWVQKYSGIPNSTNYPNSMALDYKDNVLITGTMYTSQSGYNFETMKYNSAGSLQWTASYNGTANSTDIGYSVATDPSGNVFVTGYATDSITGQDIVIIKYDYYGAQQWKAIIDAAGDNAGSPSYNDFFFGVNTDPQGNIYVVDYASASKNYKIIKYNAAGSILWQQKYPTSLSASNFYPYAFSTIDKYGNSYIAAYDIASTGNYRFLTIKYNSSGVRQWAALFGDTINGYYLPSGIAIDSSGNVLVSGSASHHNNYMVMKYSPTGVLQWVNIDTINTNTSLNKIAVDAAGNSYITGGGPNCRTIKFDQMGIKVWERDYGRSWYENWIGTDITLDPLGNLYVSCLNIGLIDNQDLVVLKYNSSGNQLWMAVQSEPGSISDPIKLCLDNLGNIYTAETIGAGTNDSHYHITKFTSAGTEIWNASYIGAADICTDMAVDAAGNVFLTGGQTVKYNSSGIFQWADYRDISSPYYPHYTPELKLDPFGNLYVAALKHIEEYETAGFLLKFSQVSNKPVLHASKDNNTGNNLPGRFALYDNYPNPFNPVTKINYDLPVNSMVNLVIYDILGKEVIKLVNNEYKEAGRYSEELDGTNLSSGVYFYRINANQYTETKKMVLVK